VAKACLLLKAIMNTAIDRLIRPEPVPYQAAGRQMSPKRAMLTTGRAHALAGD
jgi:hypothetical protein